MRHVEHAIGAEREDILDAVGGGDPNGRDSGELACVATNLVGVVHIDADELEIGMLDRTAQGACPDVPRRPLDHAVAFCQVFSRLQGRLHPACEHIETDAHLSGVSSSVAGHLKQPLNSNTRLT